jgi:hypothetical protein
MQLADYRMQSALKGIWLPFATALKAISDSFASCRKVFEYRMQYSLIFADFLDFDAVSNPFLKVAKRNLIPFRDGTKGGKKPFQRSFCISLLHETIL